jgi:DNA invertase Pin-like site-specific DNA recombinase
VKTVLVETANRFARDAIVQEIGFRKLRDMGFALIAVDSPNAFVEDTPTLVLVRRALEVIAQFDKAMTVEQLAAGRARKKAATGKCEGRKRWAEMNPKLVKRARELYREQETSHPALAAQLEEEASSRRAADA